MVAVGAPGTPKTGTPDRGAPNRGTPNRRALAGRLRHLPVLLAVNVALLAVATGLGWWVRGAPGAGGAAAGVALVAASYVISSVTVAWADSIEPRLVMPVGLGVYAVKFVLIGLVMAVMAEAEWVGLPAMGVAIVVAALAWTCAQAWWVWRAKILYVQP